MQHIKKCSIIFLLLCFMPFMALAQQHTLTMSGTVSDEEGETLPGVSVYFKNRVGIGTSTNMNGHFSIRASAGDIMVFSFVGYQDFEHVVTAENTNMTVTLSLSTDQIEEIVIVGLGQQRRVSVVGAITTVNVADLQTPATSVANMLGGRASGIITMLESGEPGQNISEFWVRGIGTFGASSSALVLIDGLEGDLNSVDPADIESFSILKDASATAVYGVRGANGVILITTKRGQSGRLNISARANFTISHLNRMPEYLRAYDYAKLANEAREVRGDLPLFGDMEMMLLLNNLDPDLYPDINWQREIMRRTGFQQTYYMSARGGGDVARYFISLGGSSEGAAYKVAPENTIRTGVGYNTYNYRVNLDINMTSSTILYFGADGFLSIRQQPGFANTDAMWQAQSMLTPLTIPIRYSTGQLPAYGAGANMSPYVMLNHTGTQTNQVYRGKATLAVVQDLSALVENLSLRVQGAFDNVSYFDETRYLLPEMFRASGRDIRGNLQIARTVDPVSAQYVSYQRQFRKYHLETTLNWSRVIDDRHRVSGLLYYYMSDEKDTRDPEQVEQGRRSMTAIPKRYQGISSRLTYGYMDTYMIDFNFGYTGSENFEPGKQFGFFPSVALGWVPSNYEWMKNQFAWLNFLKIRGSYGSVGSDRIADHRFPYMTLVSEGGGVGWGSGVIGVSESQYGADNLVWERALKANVGIEGRLFNESVSFVVDFFNDTRDGIFRRRESIPNYAGLTFNARPYGNVGSMRSYGTDGNASYTHKFGSDLAVTVRGNFTYSHNEVINWEQPPQRYPYQTFNGFPTGRIQGYIASGLFRDQQDIDNSPVQTFGGISVMPGDIKYRDINGDGVINSDDMVFLSDPTFPRLMYGFGGEVKYRNFTLGVLFRGTGKTDFYHVGYERAGFGINGPGYVPFNNGETGNVLKMVNDPANRWIPMEYAIDNGIDPSLAENPDARFPRLTYGYNANNSRLSTWWKGDSRYLRLQEVSLNYNMRNDAISRIGIRSIDLQLVGNNLYVWDKIGGLWDPEQAWRNGRAYPIPSRYAFQIFIHF